ncbi:MAG TPA: histidine phosphatase family protein [Candidatus Eisenbacteria bacterium]
MSLSLYLLRHGQTDQSRENVFCGAGLDPELTADGRAMAEAFAAAYRTTLWSAIYSSSQRRAMATAAPLATAVGVAPEVRDGLKEIAYGAWEGLSAEQVGREFHDDHIRWTADPAWNAPTGGEPATMIARRAMKVVEEIIGNCRDGNVLVVSHKATIRILLCALLGIEIGHFRFRLACPVGSVSVVEFGDHGPMLKGLADRRHLDERLRNLPGT